MLHYGCSSMGCGSSSAFAYGPAPPNLDQADGAYDSGVGEINRRRTGYVLDVQGAKYTNPWQKYFSREGQASGGDIKDHTGRVVYTILPHTGDPNVTMANAVENALSRKQMHIVKG